MEDSTVSDIALVIVSGLGIIHGMLLATFLFLHKKGNRLSNQLLGFLLLNLSFRVGKSVLLEFSHDLHIKIIFIGLGSMLIIGPLFYLFSKSLQSRSFSIKKVHLLHFLPAFIGISFGLWIEESHTRSLPISIFIIAYTIYYGHYLVYIVFSFHAAAKALTLNPNNFQLVRMIFFGLMGIWFAYFLNLFDENIPYIIGPILYSVVAYTLSIVIIKNRFIDNIDHEKYKSTQISEDLSADIFSKIQKMMIEDKEYKNPELTLKFLTEQLNMSTQIISMVINQKSGKNFNTYINHFRIQEASKQLKDPKLEHYTISAIAMESGFNSISSFNTAFKKQTGLTPLTFRNLR